MFTRHASNGGFCAVNPTVQQTQTEANNEQDTSQFSHIKGLTTQIFGTRKVRLGLFQKME